MSLPVVRPALTGAGLSALLLGGLTAVAGPAAADPVPGTASNLGLCSSYLADRPAPLDPLTGGPLGGNARSGVNLLIQRYGAMLPDAPTSPGDLYRDRAQEHPDRPAQVECEPRREL